MSKPKCYIAGPFFNPAQIELVEQIERTVDFGGFDVRSPRKIFICPPNAGNEIRESTFQGNLKEIEDSALMIAILDYLLPTGKGGGRQNLRVVEERRSPEMGFVQGGISPPINIPDQGTLFEIGYAFSVKTPVVGFLSQGSAKMNLMLAQCMHRFFAGKSSKSDYGTWMMSMYAMDDVKSGRIKERLGWDGSIV